MTAPANTHLVRGVGVGKEGSVGEGGGAYGLLADHHPLHRLDLGHVVVVGPQLPLLDAPVDGDQQFSRDVLTVVHP